MRKNLLLIFAIAVVAVLVAPTASAGTLNFLYGISDYGSGCQWPGNNNGETTDFAYWQNNSNGRYLESDFTMGTPHPDDNGIAGNGLDLGSYLRTGCTSSYNSANLQDGAQDLGAGDQVVGVSIWADTGGGAGTAITHANFPDATTWVGYYAVFSGQSDGIGDLTLSTGFTTLAACEIGVNEAADSRVIYGTVHPDTGNDGWVHLEWSAAPAPIMNPAVNNLGTVIRGWDVWSSNLDPANSTPADFGQVNGDGAVRNDGTTVAAPTTNASGFSAGGNFFFNDRNASDVQAIPVPGANLYTHYAVSPVLTEGPSWADGVNAYFEGASWYPVGQKGPTPSSQPNGAEVLLFSATLNPNGDKVTLEWRTGSEAGIIGFNIVRKFKLRGQDRGRSTQVNRSMIVATGDGSDYSFVDGLRLPPQLKRSRGLTVEYELQVVGVDGTSSTSMSSSVTPKVTR